MHVTNAEKCWFSTFEQFKGILYDLNALVNTKSYNFFRSILKGGAIDSSIYCDLKYSYKSPSALTIVIGLLCSSIVKTKDIERDNKNKVNMIFIKKIVIYNI